MSEVLVQSNFPLHDAVLRQDLSIIERLLDDGFDVNAMHYDRVTPLHVASLSGSIKILKILIKRGAWINAQSIDNSTPLCDACAGGDAECVKTLLLSGAWVNPPLCLSTPLHEAALRGNCEVVSILLSAGAAVNLSDLHYGTPLHAVCSMLQPNIDCIKVLLKAGAKINAIKIHKTPLHLIAQKSQSVKAAELLLLYGANVYLEDGNGMKPRNLCRAESELASLLEFHERQPKSLVNCCRLVIRNYLGSCNLKYIYQYIPNILIELID